MRTYTAFVLEEVRGERRRQDAKFPDQHLPDGTGGSWSEAHYRNLLDRVRLINDSHAQTGEATWESVLAEEVFEALLEADPVALRAELIQVAAVAVRWIEDIDQRGAA
jgi:hypothetical protein